MRRGAFDLHRKTTTNKAAHRAPDIKGLPKTGGLNTLCTEEDFLRQTCLPLCRGRFCVTSRVEFNLLRALHNFRPSYRQLRHNNPTFAHHASVHKNNGHPECYGSRYVGAVEHTITAETEDDAIPKLPPDARQRMTNTFNSC